MTASPRGVPQRLRASADIKAVFAARRSRAGRLLVVHARRHSDGHDPTRVAVVASRRVGSAVRRNRAKRLLREAARRTPWADGHDVVLTARGGCPDAHVDEVAHDMRRTAARLDVLGEAVPCP